MTTKTPLRLRDINLGGRTAPVHLGFGLLAAAACWSDAGPAQAQPAGPSRLPEMTVDAPAPAPRPKTPPRRPGQPAMLAAEPKPDATAPAEPAAPVPAAAAAAVAGAAPAGRTAAQAAAPNANPRANPVAPWDVQRSASTRLPEPVAEQPRTLTIIPKEVLTEKGATSVRELVRTTAGLTLGSGEGGNAFGDRVFIRGFDARNDMYIDGIRQAGVTTRENFMTEQVEILAGPSGSVSGRGTAGGAMNIVTKKPLQSNFTQVDLTGGTDATKRVTIDANQVINDKFSIRTNLLVQDADVAGRDHVFDKRYGAAIAGEWRPTDDVKVSLDYFFVYFDQMPDWGVPFDPRTRRPFTESGVARTAFYGITSRDFQQNAQHMATAGVEWSVTPDLTINSRLRYSYTLTDYIRGVPGTPNLSNRNPNLWTVPSGGGSRYQISRALANQTDVTYKFETFGFNHTLVAGTEVSRELVSIDTYTGLNIECFPNCTGGGTGVNLLLFAPNGASIASAASPTLAGRSSVTKVDTASVYVLDTAKWDQWIFTLGGRLDNYHIERTPPGAASIARSDLIPNWNASLANKIIPTVTLYGAYATSSNPIGDELDATSDAYGGLATNNAVFRPEQNRSIELGAKAELFDRRMLATFAAFQTDKEHARETVGTTLQDTAAYRIRGVQFGSSGNITDRWSLFGGAVFLQSAMTNSALPGNAGLPLANIAHQSFNLLSKYQVTDKWSIGAQATYKSEILGGTLQAVNYAPGTVNVAGASVATPGGYNKLPGGWRFDLMSNYQLTEALSARFLIQNIANATLYDAFYRSTTPFVYLAPGRVAYVTLSARF